MNVTYLVHVITKKYCKNNKFAMLKERIHTMPIFVKVFNAIKLILTLFLVKDQEKIINSHCYF